MSILMAWMACRDADEYDDPYDEEAPPPPECLYPLPDTVIACGSTHAVFFDWTEVEGAQRYDIQIDTTENFDEESMYFDDNPPRTLTLNRYDSNTKYYWRVRAASVYWRTLFTEWSEVRVFYLVREL